MEVRSKTVTLVRLQRVLEVPKTICASGQLSGIKNPLLASDSLRGPWTKG